MSAMPRAAALLLIAFTELLLAGCTAGTDDGTGQTIGRPDAQFDASTGAILGLVLNQDELPIAGASVGLTPAGMGAEQTTQTTDGGEFVFSRLAPGEYTVGAVALGYSTASTVVTVEAGEVAEGVQIILEAAATTEPYALLFQERRTISAVDAKPLPMCVYFSDYAAQAGSLKTCTGFTTSGCDDPTPCDWNWSSIMPAESNWKTILHEGMWTGSSAATGRSFSIDLATPSYRNGSYNYEDKEVFVDEGNDPPLVIRVDYPTTLIERDLDLEKEYCCGWHGWHTRLFGASCTMGYCYAGFGPDYGILIDQTIDLYFSFGFNAPLPEGYTAVPEES